MLCGVNEDENQCIFILKKVSSVLDEKVIRMHEIVELLEVKPDAHKKTSCKDD